MISKYGKWNYPKLNVEVYFLAILVFKGNVSEIFVSLVATQTWDSLSYTFGIVGVNQKFSTKTVKRKKIGESQHSRLNLEPLL
jgi:hypothetical protein